MRQNQSLGAKDHQTNVQSQPLNDNYDQRDVRTQNYSNIYDNNNGMRADKKQEKTEEKTQTKTEQKREKQKQKQLIQAPQSFNTDFFLNVQLESRDNQNKSHFTICDDFCKPAQEFTLRTILVICAQQTQDGNYDMNIIPSNLCYTTNKKKFVSCLHNMSNPKNDPKCAQQYGWKLEGNFFNKGSQANYKISDWNDACAYSDENRNIICNFLRNHVLKYTKQQDSKLLQVNKLPQIVYMLEILESKQQYKNNLRKGSNELQVLIQEKYRST